MVLSRAKAALATLAATPRVRVRLMVILVLVLAGVLLFRGLRQGAANGRTNDFAAFHEAARAALRGDLAPAYSAASPYQYPPTLATLILPLGLLPPAAAGAVWTIGSLVLLLWSLRLSTRALAPGLLSLDQVPAFLLAFRMLESDFANGNANTLVLFLLLLGFALIRGGRGLAGGGVLGVAAAVKVTPAFLLVWLLARGRFRQANGFLLGLVVVGAVFPLIVLGPHGYARACGAFYESTLAPLNPAGSGYEREAEDGFLAGQSLRALLHRLLRPIDATAHDETQVSVAIANLPKGAVDALYAALAVAALAALLWRFRTGNRDWSGAEIGAALAAMVLLAPLSRKAHFVVLYPAAAASLAAVRAACPRDRLLPAALWAAAFALTALTAPAIIGRTAATYVLAYCPLAFAAGILAALCALMRPGALLRPGAPAPVFSSRAVLS